MIKYVEKGVGMHATIVAAGHSLHELDGVWTSSDDRAVQAIIDAYPLSATQAEVTLAIGAHAKALRDAVVARVSPGEMASWPIKRAEALRYQETRLDIDAPLLTAEAGVRGVAGAVLAEVVLANAARLLQLEAQIAGTTGKHKAAVRAASTFEEVLGYDWSAGWPKV